MPTIDLALLLPQDDGSYVQALALPGQEGRQVTSTEKLVQRFLLELLTEVGSMPYLSRRGTTFLADLRQAPLLSELDAYAVLAAAVQRAGAQIQAEESSTDPDDERFASATIQSLQVAATGTSVQIAVASRSGQAIGLRIPLVIG